MSVNVRNLFNRFGESGVGAIIGGGHGYLGAKKGKEDFTGTTASTLTGAAKGAAGTASLSLLIRKMKARNAMKHIKAQPRIHSYVDRIRHMEDASTESARQFRLWEEGDSLEKAFGEVKKKHEGVLPHNFNDALELLEEKKKALDAQREVMGDSPAIDPQSYFQRVFAGDNIQSLEDEVKNLSSATGKARRISRGEFQDLSRERDHIKNQIQQQQEMMREILEEERQMVNNNINSRIFGIY